MSRLAATAALGLAVACSPGVRSPRDSTPEPVPATSAPSATVHSRVDPCAGYSTIAADVDGDGRPDRVFHAGVGDFYDPQVGVCLATGAFLHAEGRGMTELFAVYDVDGDGKDELFPGGTTAAARGYNVIEYTGGRLAYLPIELWSGGVHGEQEFGCPDHRLVQVTVEGTDATVTTYVLRAGHVTTTTEHRAVASGTPAGTLVRPCPRITQ